MKKGFVPALGTPLNKEGKLLTDSYVRQIARMMDAGAAGLLCMGSMGQQAFILSDVCVDVAQTAVKAARGAVPVFVGVMDNSIARVSQRMRSMEKLDLTAFVLTTPYYEVDTEEQIITFFKRCAAATGHGIVLYDLPSVTGHKITYEMVCRLHQEVPNCIGIKSADLAMMRKLRLNPDFAGFTLCYSGLDTFDIAYCWGIDTILDGMLSCTPVNIEKLVRALDCGDKKAAAHHLDNIVALRDLFIQLDLWPAYSYAMNLLGYEGTHTPDWAQYPSAEVQAAIRQELIRIGELPA